MCSSDLGFWADCYDDCVPQCNFRDVFDRYDERQRVLLQAAEPQPKRRNGPKPDLVRLGRISNVVNGWARSGRDWRDHLSEVAKALDRAKIPTPAGQGGKVVTSWSAKLETTGGPDKICKQIQYALKAVLGK